MSDQPNTQAVTEPEKTQPEAENKLTLEQAQAEIARINKELADTRKEAAKYRVEKKEAVEKVEATVAERLSALEKQLTEERKANLTNSVANKFKIPELATRLKGETVEELEADAQALAAIIKAQLPDPQKPPTITPTSPDNPQQITLEAIKKMTPQEIMNNQAAVNAVLSGGK
jgi:hypothetical protein